MSPAKPPEILDKIADLVLAYKPKPKSKAAKKRKKLAKKQSASKSQPPFSSPEQRRQD